MAKPTCIFTVQLLHEKKNKRVLAMRAETTLATFAEAITDAFGIEEDYAFGFYSTITPGWDRLTDGPHYELFADLSPRKVPEAQSVAKTTVASVWKQPKDRMLFLFDYGDERRFIVTLQAFGETEKGIRYPHVISATGAAPKRYPDEEEDGGGEHEDHAGGEDVPMSATQLADGMTLVTGGNPEADDGCAVCQFMKRAERRGTPPTRKEVDAAMRATQAQGATVGFSDEWIPKPKKKKKTKHRK